MIYLDYSANTPADPRVAEAFLRASLDFPGNPNSKHPAGQAAANALSESRNRIAELLSVLPEELIFTSGATESNNLALLGSVAARRHIGRHIISTALEHPSVSACLSHLQENGYEIDLLPILSNGRIDLEALSSLLRKDTCLVALSAVDSELGTVQPLAEAAAHIRRFSDCHFHVDATQSVGKTPVDFSVADSVSFAPHKFYGLTGSGVLYKKKGIPLLPQLHGGESDSPYRSGTPALAEIKALEYALKLALTEQDSRNEAVRAHNAYLRTALSKEKKVSINSPADAVPHILNLSIAGNRGFAVQTSLAAADICISVKSACSSDALPSRAVFAVSRSRKNALASFRVSLSHLTTREELDALLSALAPLLHA